MPRGTFLCRLHSKEHWLLIFNAFVLIYQSPSLCLLGRFQTKKNGSPLCLPHLMSAFAKQDSKKPYSPTSKKKHPEGFNRRQKLLERYFVTIPKANKVGASPPFRAKKKKQFAWLIPIMKACQPPPPGGGLGMSKKTCPKCFAIAK